MRRPGAADLLVAGTAALLLAGDVHLYRRHLELVTDVLRRPVPLACLTVLTLHAWDVLGPLDPFRAAGRLIPRK